MILANLLNIAANWALVLGHLGSPALGARGFAMATLIARLFMCIAMFAAHYFHDARNEGHFARHGLPFERDSMLKVLRLGVPSALQMTFEVGVFALSTTLAAG